MSRISDVLIEIHEYLGTNMTDEEIAERVGCPVSWVAEERDFEQRELF